MINLDEARKSAFNNSEYIIDVKTLIYELDKIYDSIGSCGECDRWRPFTEGCRAGTCSLKGESTSWFRDDYCSKFKRLKDD